MNYELTVSTNANSTFCVIVKNPQFLDNGVLEATKVATFEGLCDTRPVYRFCEPTKIMVCGTLILEEYTGNIIE